jgi:hypothetical protein
VGFFAVSFSRFEPLRLVSSRLFFVEALCFSFYFWNFSCPFIPFLDKSCIKLTELFTCTTFGLSSWLIPNLIATHFSLAMHVVAPVTLQSQIGTELESREMAKRTAGNKPPVRLVIPLVGNRMMGQ